MVPGGPGTRSSPAKGIMTPVPERLVKKGFVMKRKGRIICFYTLFKTPLVLHRAASAACSKF